MYCAKDEHAPMLRTKILDFREVPRHHKKKSMDQWWLWTRARDHSVCWALEAQTWMMRIRVFQWPNFHRTCRRLHTRLVSFIQVEMFANFVEHLKIYLYFFFLKIWIFLLDRDWVTQQHDIKWQCVQKRRGQHVTADQLLM